MKRELIYSAAYPSFLLSYLIHHPGLRNRIYSDIVTFWFRPIAGRLKLPYIEAMFEYPPISGFLTYLAALIGGDIHGFYTAFSIIILIFYTILIESTYRIAAEKRVNEFLLIIFLALSPSMILYSVYNFDVIFSAILMSSLLLLKRRRSLSAILFGLAMLTKWANLILLPVALMLIEGWKNRIKYSMISLGSFISVNLILYLINPELMPETYLHHLEWGLENAWFIVFFPNNASWDTAKIFSFMLMGYGLLKVYLCKLGDLYEKSFMAYSVFLLTTYKFTPQMVVWILPFLALMNRIPWGYFMLEFANAGIILTWFDSPDPTRLGSLPQYLAILRAIILFYILVDVYLGLKRRRAHASA